MDAQGARTLLLQVGHVAHILSCLHQQILELLSRGRRSFALRFPVEEGGKNPSDAAVAVISTRVRRKTL